MSGRRLEVFRNMGETSYSLSIYLQVFTSSKASETETNDINLAKPCKNLAKHQCPLFLKALRVL
jgi:hypothetical protein